jgi:uncharacterized protein YeaO (DUF488 family)
MPELPEEAPSPEAMIRTKSTSDPISSRDGLRLFVTRYWPRGHKRQECDEWIPSLAPSQKLLKQFDSGKISWAEFKSAYREEMLHGYKPEAPMNERMRNSGQKYFIRLLRRLSEDRTITLICTCPPDQERCHRHLLRALIEK